MIAACDIRLAGEADARPIAEMSRDLVEYGLGWKWTAGRIRRCIANPAINVATARAGGALRGFAIMEYKEEEAHLMLFAVDPVHRQQGVGTALLEWLEETALAAGIGLIYLEARAGNFAARTFYARHGYNEIAQVRGMYRGKEDGVRMARDLWWRP